MKIKDYSSMKALYSGNRSNCQTIFLFLTKTRLIFIVGKKSYIMMLYLSLGIYQTW